MISVYFNMELNFVIRRVVKVYILRGVQQIYDVTFISISHRSWKKNGHRTYNKMFIQLRNEIVCRM
jgi:hypothetical protein